MVKLPAIMDHAVVQIESDALALARRHLAKWRDNGTPYSSDPLMTPGASRAAVLNIYCNIVRLNIEHREVLIEWARAGDDVADEALRGLIRDLLSRGEPLPTELASYNMSLVSGSSDRRFRKKKAQKWYHNLLRDIFVAWTVAALLDRFGFTGMKSTGRSPHRKSACAIVAEAMVQEEFIDPCGTKDVERIWNKYKGAAPTVPGWAWAS